MVSQCLSAASVNTAAAGDDDHDDDTLVCIVNACLIAVAVLGKNIWGAGPSSFGRQQRLSEIYYRTN